MTAALACATCGTEPSRVGARFCDACGAPLGASERQAEFKQVTVLFADVVRSMDIAAAVGAERLREIMTELVNRAATVIRGFGGTVDKFTGDGIMAVFGAPCALEDHAVRACLAALGIQEEIKGLAVEVEHRDGICPQLRVGLNSGQVIAGDIGASPLGYTAVGEQVGMAERMESGAPPGGVMLSESTAHLVRHTAVLGKPELVRIKGGDKPVPARRLLAIQPGHGLVGRVLSSLVGRQWEIAALEAILDRSIDGHGSVVGVVGAAGVGKSRVILEAAAIAAGRGVEMFWTFCESHASAVPFHAMTNLLSAVFGVVGLDAEAARAQARLRAPDANEQDLILLDDLLGIGGPDMPSPKIDPDARRRRLTALINAVQLARTQPILYVIEDVHWIDEVSESMLADFIAVIPQTPSMVLITYRPEYQGALARVPNAQTIALGPLSDSETAALIAELLGPDPSVVGLAATIAERAVGNPFFVEEIVRDLAERDVLQGKRGAYVCRGDVAEVGVPATLQATIAARIDRLDVGAKQTLSAAAVIGSRFSPGVLCSVGIDPVLDELVKAELIEPVKITPRGEYAFCQPLIRAVAYESQLISDRAELHRRLAAAIERTDPGSADGNAALIAEHLEAAGELHAAFAWRMRAGTWSTLRDVAAARVSWQRARQIADRLPADDPDRMSMRIAPRTLLCGSVWRVGGSIADVGFGELRELCTAAGDQVSLVFGMAGLVLAHMYHNQHRESSRLATELARLLESIGDPTLTVALLGAAIVAKYEAGEMAEALRLSQQVIDLADGDPAMGNLLVGSPLAIALTHRGTARMYLGIPGWRDDFDQSIALARTFEPTTRALVVMYKYVLGFLHGTLLLDEAALTDTAEALQIAEHSGDNFALGSARLTRGITLIQLDPPQREVGYDLLAKAKDMALKERYSLSAVPIVDIATARGRARNGDLDGAIELSRSAIDVELAGGEMQWCGPATTTLVESLLRRGTDADLQEAQAAIDRLAGIPTDPGFVMHELPLLRLRALLARVHGDEAGYRNYRDRYREMARSLGFEGHMKSAEAIE
ncbi:MAG TPA: adenylate/guanylate cyclase domain-containing protein [Mycobacterium sp.]|nr:adenylate/guanylate cyclase domain-containing protein [Mycobacterium sp.]